MTGNTRAELTPDNPDLPLVGVSLHMRIVLSDSYLQLPFEEYNDALDRQLTIMKRDLTVQAKEEWFKRQDLYTKPSEFTKE